MRGFQVFSVGICLTAACVAPINSCIAQFAQPTRRFVIQSPLDQRYAKQHTNGLGQPCLNVEAAALGQRINNAMYDHVISIVNKCGQTIKVNICYFGTKNCALATVPGYGRKDTTIGTFAGMTTFRYDLQEIFDSR